MLLGLGLRLAGHTPEDLAAAELAAMAERPYLKGIVGAVG